jgi:signal transduction histidine kinase
MQPSTTQFSLDEAGFWLAAIPATSLQRQRTLIIMALLLVAFVAAAVFAPVRLVEGDGFIPVVQAVIFVTDLVTAILLFTQFSLVRSRALLVLASAYLFTALIVIPHTLSFPRVFAPRGLLGAGLQTTGWLHIIWHFGFPAAVTVYALMKDWPAAQNASQTSPASAVCWSAAIVISLVCATTFGLIVAGPILPRLFVDRTTFSPLVFHAGLFDSIVCAIALVLLWARRRSVLDQWLMIAVFATLLEMIMVTFFSGGRFDVGWYSVRFFSVVASTVVLIALLTETTRLYARLALTLQALRRERDIALTNVEAVVAAIAHEVKQPLTGIVTKGAAARRFIDRDQPDIDKAQGLIDDMITASFRANEVFDNIRALFRTTDEKREPIDVNKLLVETLRAFDAGLDGRGVTMIQELTPRLSPIEANKGQLQEVIFNLVQNAFDAMKTVRDRPRILRVKSAEHDHSAVEILIEDSGPGIQSQKLDSIFDAFVTTKAQGIGLGLAISRLIVERHAGTISASSQIGSGAQFRIVLPKSKGQARHDASRGPAN